MKNIISTLIIFLFICLSFNRESATSVRDKSDHHFSALNAFEYLKTIAKETHPIGSLENIKVRDYLVKTLKDEGLEVKVESGYTRTSWKPSYNKMAYVENVIAILKGTDPNAKKIILAGHYDSVMEGPGAADDGYAVACMVETARLLKTQNRKHDLVLLITDGEEYGLLGAQYHLENNEMDDVALVLNYEARGASGPGIAFEWSENNAWLVKEVAKAYKRPIANSLSYEIYQRMPNASDFTIFQRKDLPGVNHAFIDDFSYYHHPQDDLKHVSKESIQHTGENMYLAAKHFINMDFDGVKKGNASFFNFYGGLIYYPASFDLFILLLGILLMLFYTVSSVRKEESSVKDITLTFLSILGIIVLCAGLNFGLSYLAKEFYPQYHTFYSYHYYNHKWYLLAGLGLSLTMCYFLGRILIRKYGPKAIGIATLFVISILSILIYTNAPTGTYIMSFPLLFLSVGLIGQQWLSDDNNKVNKKWIVGMISILLFVGLWTFVTHALYLAFSLNILAGAIIPFVIFCFAMMALLPTLWTDNDKTLLFIGALLFVVALFIAHLKSKATVEKPLKSNLFYLFDGESKSHKVASFDDYINDGHLGLLDEAKEERLPRQFPYSNFYKDSNIDLSSYRSTITKNGQSVTFHNPKRAFMSHIFIRDISNVDSILVDGVLNKNIKKGASGQYYSPMFGIGMDTLRVDIIKRDTSLPVNAYINMEYNEMPETEDLPEYTVRNGGLVYISEFIEF